MYVIAVIINLNENWIWSVGFYVCTICLLLEYYQEPYVSRVQLVLNQLFNVKLGLEIHFPIPVIECQCFYKSDLPILHNPLCITAHTSCYDLDRRTDGKTVHTTVITNSYLHNLQSCFMSIVL